jgi:glycosyltransferase involved in cell wall biosynthesis
LGIKFLSKREDAVKICRVGTVPSSILLIRQQIIETAQLGQDVTVVCSTFDESSPASITFAQLDLPKGVKHIDVNITRNISLLNDLKALISLFLIFRRERFDVVHSIMPKASLLVAVAAFFALVPVRLHTFTGQRWVTLKGPKRRLLKFFDWVVAVLNTQVFADSNSQAKFLESEGIAKSISVIGSGSISGVNLSEFDQSNVTLKREEKRRELGFKNDETVIIFVGRLNPDKGVSELYDAFTACSKVRSDLRLLIVGAHEKSLDVVHPGLHAKLKSDPRIRLIGFCDSLVPFMSAADFLVLPSYREGFGNVVIEAGALGLPTIGTKIYGLEDAILDGETGDLIPPKNSRELEAKILEWTKNPEKVKKLGRSALERVVSNFDSKIVTNQLIDRYSQLHTS